MSPTVNTVSETNLEGLSLLHRGKVRDVYQINERELLLVATDRISAFDCVIPTPISHKGAILTALSQFWFQKLQPLTANHLITGNFEEMPAAIREHENLRGRSLVVKKTRVFPIECVARGYLAGSGWKDYLQNGAVCGHQLPPNMQEAERLPAPIFTPATKATSGHDENISEAEVANIVGAETAQKLRQLTLDLYAAASEYALSKGIIIADTKFEFGLDERGEIILIDEALTPDSSRFWSLENYQPGGSPASFDKQFVRDYLETLDWDKKPPAPELPPEIAKATTQRYEQAFEILTGESFDLTLAGKS